jgi:hypothetical protein
MFKRLQQALVALLASSPVHAPPAAQAQGGAGMAMSDLSSSPDLPQAFGYKMTWLAVRSENTEAVFDALALTQKTVANWETGIQFSYGYQSGQSQTPVFVTPPVDGWTLVLTGLGLAADGDASIARLEGLLRQMSGSFGEVHYYGSYRVVGYVAWYKAESGEISRGFSFADGSLYANVGPTTTAETEAGYFDMTGMTEDALWETILSLPEEDNSFFNEEDPMKIAGKWSVNPLLIAEIPDQNPSLGLAGYLALPQAQ